MSEVLTVHAVLVNIDNTGILITGESGSGKSETALRLISRGHALVADDVVEIKDTGFGLVGSAPVQLRRFLEIRNIGIVDVVGLFGSGSYLQESSVDAVVEIVGPDHSDNECLGIGFATIEILGKSLPKLRVVNHPTRDLPLLIEIAVKMLKQPQVLRPPGSIKMFA